MGFKRQRESALAIIAGLRQLALFYFECAERKVRELNGKLKKAIPVCLFAMQFVVTGK